MGFFIYKQYLYYMNIKLTESQYILLTEQNKIKSIIKAAKQLDTIPTLRVDLKVPIKKISSLSKKLSPLNKKQLTILSDIEVGKDLDIILKNFNDTYVEYSKVLENHFLEYFKNSETNLDYNTFLQKINDGDSSFINKLTLEEQNFLFNYSVINSLKNEHFNIIKNNIRNKFKDVTENFIKNSDKENFKQLSNLRKSNTIDNKQYWFFLKNPKEWFNKKVEFNIVPTKSEIDITTDNLLDEIPNLTDGEIRIRIEFYESIGRDDLVKILKKEIDTPKNVKQVAGVKVDISNSDLEKINSSIKKRGVKNWGMVDGTDNLPATEKILVNGEETYFSLNENGFLIKRRDNPKHSDGTDLFPHFSIKARESCN